MNVPGAKAGYFDLDFYRRIHATVKSWVRLDAIEPEMRPDSETEQACEGLVLRESRLIDQDRLDEWLDLFTEDAAYWLPTDTKQLDPALTVSWEFNDRRRMEERVERLLTGKAHSQIPRTRSTHLYTNIEQVRISDDEVHLLCNFLINASRPEGQRILTGWNGFILRRVDDQWLIEFKRVNLVDADAPQGNLSFFL
jgi:ethylbenzene dioxygenase beta subunit